MNETEITVILPTPAAKELFFDGWLHGFEPSTWLKARILQKLSNEPSTPPLCPPCGELAEDRGPTATPAEVPAAPTAPAPRFGSLR